MKKLILCLSLFISQVTFAYTGAVSSATANSGVAAVEVGDSPFLNPATLAQIRGYHFTYSYSFFDQKDFGTANEFSLSLIDNMPETVIATSLGYSQTSTKNDIADSFERKDLRLSVAGKLFPKLSMGFGFSFHDDAINGEKIKQANTDLAFLWTPNSNWGIGAVGQNISKPKDLEYDEFQLEQKMILGLNFNYKRFLRVKADLSSNERYVWNKPAAAVGLESFLNRWVVLRLGVKRDFFTENNYFGTGLGFVGPKFSIHYAYLSGQETEKSTRHTLDLNVPIW